MSISLEERERRHAELRREMEAEGLDVLVIYGRGEPKHRGRVFYASDIWQYAGDAFVVLPLRGEPFFVNTPLVGLDEARLSDWITDLRMDHEPGTVIGDALGDLGLGRGAIGVAGLSDAVPYANVEELRRSLRDADLRDASKLFDRVRQVKSAEEIGYLEETSAALRRVFAGIGAEIRPGVQQRQILAHAVRLAREHGCRDVMAYMAASPFTSYTFGSDDTVERGSAIIVWLECAGPSGYWLELSRCYSFGAPSERSALAWAVQIESFEAALDVLRPGAAPREILEATGRVHRSHGFGAPGPDSTYSAHGIGTDTVEGVWVPGSERALADGEVLSLHPFMTIPDERDAREMAYLGVTDNVLVTPDGGRRLTYTTAEWVEL